MYDVAVIGCGIVGAVAAYELSRYNCRVLVLEAKNDVANVTTKANSAILHAGYDPTPGTLMAETNVRGVALAKELCEKLDVEREEIGSLVLAFGVYGLIFFLLRNASIVLRLWDRRKSLLMLGDTGEESGDRLLRSVPREELDCDYIQLAHHGQMGVREEFYRTVRFRACLWPTPLWVWNNDVGEGYDTAWMKTPETRRWMDEKGITEHHCAWQGLVKIE